MTISVVYFLKNVKRATYSFKVHFRNTALFHLLQLSPLGLIRSAGQKVSGPHTRLWDIFTQQPWCSQEQPSTSTLSKQLSSLCRTFPAVRKQSFVSPLLDTSSSCLPPSGQICSDGRWCLNICACCIKTDFEKIFLG